MQYQYELVWLAKQVEKQKVSKQPSIWNGIRRAQFDAQKMNVEAKRHVYITGDAQVVFEMTNIFDSLSTLHEVVTVTSKKSAHPALQWMTITYYPPQFIEQLPETKAFTLFMENRLPVWSRNLFLQNKVCNVVSKEEIPAIGRFPNVTTYRADTFSYMNLLDDVIIREETVIKSPSTQLYPEVPKQYVLKLSATQNAKEIEEILDDAAASMLNTYWLQNHPPFPQWMPILLREIREFLTIKHNIKSNKDVLQKLKVWGNRDKRIS